MNTAAVSTAAWGPLEPDVQAWLDEFDHRSAGGDGAADLFAGSFPVLDPANSFTLTPAVLAAALTQRRAMFDAAGVGTISRVGAQQLRLDAGHVLIRASWTAPRAGRSAVLLESTFLVRREPVGWRVVVYLNHHDVAAMLASND